MERSILPKYASFGRRFLAHQIDTIILWVPLYLLYWVLFSYNPLILLITANSIKEMQQIQPAESFLMTYLLPIFLGLLYYVFFWVKYNGITPGKRLLAIKIVRQVGRPMTILTATLRYLGTLVSLWVMAIGYLWVIWDKDKQAWHDKIAKTVVVETDQKPKILVAITIVLIFYLLTIGVSYKIYQLVSKEIRSQQQYQLKLQQEQTEATKFRDSAIKKLDAVTFMKVKKNLAKSEEEQIVKLSKEAIAELKKASALNPNDYLIWDYLGEGYSHLVDIDENALQNAEVAYKKALDLNRKDFSTYGGLAWVYLAQGRYEEAISVLKESLEINANYPRGHYYLGFAYKYLGDKVEAAAELQQALKLLGVDDPLYDEAKTELFTL